MRWCCRSLTHRVSSRKFYELAQQNQERILPKSPEQLVISKYLRGDPAFPSQIPKNAAAVKGRVDYGQYMMSQPHGSILERSYKGVQLGLVSLGSQQVPLPEIYKICEKFNPDLVFLQTRPELHLPHFTLIKKNRADVFSDTLYLNQLLLSPTHTIHHLLPPAVAHKLQSMLSGDTKQTLKTEGKVEIRDGKDLVGDETILMGAHWAAKHSKQCLLGGIPQQPWREWLCNSHTLMQLQELLKNVAKNQPFYSTSTPEQIAAITHSPIVLLLRDRYMATLLEMLVANASHKRILAFLGPAENQAINQILQDELLVREGKFVPIIEYLISPEITGSILRDVVGWEIIEKHLLLDVLHHGEAVLNEPLSVFTTTNRVMAHYGQLNSYDPASLMRFRLDKTHGYVETLRAGAREGAALKEKLLVRAAMRAEE